MELYEVECIGGPQDGLHGIVSACEQVTFNAIVGNAVTTATYALAVKDGTFYLKYLCSHRKTTA